MKVLDYHFILLAHLASPGVIYSLYSIIRQDRVVAGQGWLDIKRECSLAKYKCWASWCIAVDVCGTKG